MKHLRHVVPFFLFLGLLILIGVTTVIMGPAEIINQIGVRNAYLGLAVLAFIGGVSTFTSTAFYSTVVVFAVGGLDPLFMALVAGIGLTLGDALFYYLGTQAREAFLFRYEKKMERIAKWLERRPYATPLLIFLYTGFSPFPGDILMIFLSLIKYPFIKVFIPDWLGNTTLVFLLATLASLGFSLQF